MISDKIKSICALYLEEYFDFTIIENVDYNTTDSTSVCYLCLMKSSVKMMNCNHSEKQFMEFVKSECEEGMNNYHLRIKCSQLKYMVEFAEVAFVFSNK